MSASIPSGVIQEEFRELPLSVPLNEAAWQAWLLKGRRREERNYRRRVKAANALALIGVACAAAAGILPGLSSYEVAIRFFVAAAAVALTVHAVHVRRYAFAAAFAALAVLYNPVSPLFDFSGDWGRGLIALSGIPFLASLTRPKVVPNV